MEAIGFGTFRCSENAIKLALEAGYRMLDTAAMYENESEVGKAIQGFPRKDVCIVTKFFQKVHGPKKSIEVSLKKLGLSYVDLYLVHWPNTADGRPQTPERLREIWKEMEDVLASGKAKSIGVSNYTIAHLEDMKKYAKVPPAVNQIEFHPFLYQKDLLEYCKKNAIQVIAYCPLGRGHMNEEVVTQIAQKYGKTNSQILIRWSIEHGCIPIPKSNHKERIQENIDVFDFHLSTEDMKKLDALSKNKLERKIIRFLKHVVASGEELV